jgi:gamma-glutamyltranspeptidase/glutathione hydrolase
MRLWRLTTLAYAALLPLAGCGIGHKVFGGGQDAASLGQTTAAPSVFGYAVADEPQAALVARQILNQGGNAADAAAAEGFAMAVTLPSRAGLGGGGACIIKMPDASGNARPASVLLFPPGAPASAAGSRPAAVPAMARGLLALEARYGTLPFSSVIVPAERLAGGVPVSPALAADLSVVGTAFLADPNAASVFGANGAVLGAGATLAQPDLAGTLEVLRTQGVQGFYQGQFADQLAAAATAAGGNVTDADLAATVPQFSAPEISQAGDDEAAFIPAAAPAGQALPASAGFAALDKNGGIVACAVTMNNLFGTGRVAAGTGILLAASPKANPVPVLGAAIAYRPGDGKFIAAVTGTGQEGAAAAVADGLYNALHKTRAARRAVPPALIRGAKDWRPAGADGFKNRRRGGGAAVPGDGCDHHCE